MRPSHTALAIAALVTLAACGGDEPEQAATPPRPAPTQRPAAADTTLGDTARAGQAGAQANRPSGQAAQGTRPAGQTGQAAGARPAGQPGQGGVAAPAGQRLYTVQVAAFASADSARKWTGRLNSLDLPVWTSMTELGGTTYYRVRVGAVPTVADARRLGAMLTQRFEWPVWVAPVGPADRMPEGAVAATRRVLGGG